MSDLCTEMSHMLKSLTVKISYDFVCSIRFRYFSDEIVGWRNLCGKHNFRCFFFYDINAFNTTLKYSVQTHLSIKRVRNQTVTGHQVLFSIKPQCHKHNNDYLVGRILKCFFFYAEAFEPCVNIR